MKLRQPDAGTPEGLRRDATLTVTFSVLVLLMGAWNLAEGDSVTGISCLFGGTVFLWLVHRNYRIAARLGWFADHGPDRGSVSSTDG